MTDPIGQAAFDYFQDKKAEDIIVESNYTTEETIPPSYFFRKENELPIIEKTALGQCFGKILDIGAGAGCHSIILQEKGFQVTAIEKSVQFCEILQLRGIKNVINKNILNFSISGFDTLLLLMNGTGIGGTLAGLAALLNHLKKLMNPNGQIIIDSSDISYLFEEEDGSYWINLGSDKYYGEMEYVVKYKDLVSKPFPWLFIDFKKLKTIALNCGFNCNLITEGEHFDYLASLTLK